MFATRLYISCFNGLDTLLAFRYLEKNNCLKAYELKVFKQLSLR